MPSAHCTVRVNSMCLHDLKALAAKENRSIGNMIEVLVKRAKDDPDGYFLRMAAMQSYIASVGVLNLIGELLNDEGVARATDAIGLEARQFYGGFPKPPAEVHSPKNKNTLVEAFLDVYEQRRKEQRG